MEYHYHCAIYLHLYVNYIILSSLFSNDLVCTSCSVKISFIMMTSLSCWARTPLISAMADLFGEFHEVLHHSLFAVGNTGKRKASGQDFHLAILWHGLILGRSKSAADSNRRFSSSKVSFAGAPPFRSTKSDVRCQ